MPRNISLAEFEARILRLNQGWATKVPKDVEALYVDGKKYGRHEVGQALEEIAGHLKNVATTRAAYSAAVAFRDRKLAEWQALVGAVSAQLRQRLGHASADLLGLGIAPPKERAVPTVEDRIIAAERRRQTRKARGTMGKKQRLAIKTEPQLTLRILGADGQPLSSAASPVAPPPSPPKKAPPAKAAPKAAPRVKRRRK